MQLRRGPLTLLLLLINQSFAGLSWLPTLGCSGDLGFAPSTPKIAGGRSVSQQTPSSPGYPLPTGTMLHARRLSTIYQLHMHNRSPLDPRFVVKLVPGGRFHRLLPTALAQGLLVVVLGGRGDEDR